ncbi:MAG: iron chaperone [Anaerolineae bacterium]
MEKKAAFTTIDEYIAIFPGDIQRLLKQMREAIRAAAPRASERIAYQMPTFYLEGNLVHFAAHSNHIGFYPTPSGIEAFHQELARYKTSKGAIQFPLDEPLPLELVRKITAFRAQENLAKAAARRRKPTAQV